jgi:hypothetical protein
VLPFQTFFALAATVRRMPDATFADLTAVPKSAVVC